MSTSLNVFFLSSMFSGMASMMRSAFWTASFRLSVVCMRARVSFISVSVICPLVVNFCRLVFIMFVPLSMKCCSMSRMVTLYLPVCAATWVMPCPIRPAPRTVILFIFIVVFSFGFVLGLVLF